MLFLDLHRYRYVVGWILGLPACSLLARNQVAHLKCESFLLTLRQTPSKQHPATAGQNVLPVIQLIGDRRTRDLAAGAGVPESFAIAAIERKNIAAGVAGERDAGIRSQHAGGCTIPNIVAPANFSCLVVDGLDDAFAPESVVRASPANRRRRRAWQNRANSFRARKL